MNNLIIQLEKINLNNELVDKELLNAFNNLTISEKKKIIDTYLVILSQKSKCYSNDVKSYTPLLEP